MPAVAPAPILVLGWGNPSRGDDALGPRFCEWLAAQRADGIEIVEDFQLQVEHALDLVDRRLVLFVDASLSVPDRGVAFSRIAACRDASFTTHALAPAAVLAVYEQIRSEAPPPAYLLAIGGESFELGDGLSAAAQRNLAAACAFAERLLASPQTTDWDAAAL